MPVLSRLALSVDLLDREDLEVGLHILRGSILRERELAETRGKQGVCHDVGLFFLFLSSVLFLYG